MSRVVRALFASVFSLAITIPPVNAQSESKQPQDPTAAPVQQKLDKEQKRKLKRL